MSEQPAASAPAILRIGVSVGAGVDLGEGAVVEANAGASAEHTIERTLWEYPAAGAPQPVPPGQTQIPQVTVPVPVGPVGGGGEQLVVGEAGFDIHHGFILSPTSPSGLSGKLKLNAAGASATGAGLFFVDGCIEKWS